MYRFHGASEALFCSLSLSPPFPLLSLPRYAGKEEWPGMGLRLPIGHLDRLAENPESTDWSVEGVNKPSMA